jgi:hypothetical protein
MMMMMFLVLHMMTVVETLHFATMACATRVINVKIAMTESTEHVARAEQLHQETHVLRQRTLLSKKLTKCGQTTNLI